MLFITTLCRERKYKMISIKTDLTDSLLSEVMVIYWLSDNKPIYQSPIYRTHYSLKKLRGMKQYLSVCRYTCGGQNRPKDHIGTFLVRTKLSQLLFWFAVSSSARSHFCLAAVALCCHEEQVEQKLMTRTETESGIKTDLFVGQLNHLTPRQMRWLTSYFTSSVCLSPTPEVTSCCGKTPPASF